MKQTFFCLLVWFSLNVNAQHVYISPTYCQKTTISILYFQEGSEIYTTWGHTALRVIDSNNNTDYVYNFGTFSFEQPNFVSKFAMGNLDYYVSIATYKDYLNFTKTENRGLSEIVLNLDTIKKSNLLTNLITTYTYNPHYKYDFLYDNCVTRVNQILHQANVYQYVLPITKIASYRDAILYYPISQNKHALAFGINILLGAKADVKLTDSTYNFLPYLYHNQLFNMNINENFILQEHTVLPFNILHRLYIDPIVFILLFLTIWILYLLSVKRNRTLFILSKIIIFFYSFIGLFIVFFWFVFNHKACDNNYNILWGNPLYIILMLLTKKYNVAWKILANTMFIGCLLFFIFAIDFKQYNLQLWLLNIIQLFIGFYYWRSYKILKRKFKIPEFIQQRTLKK